MSNIEQLKPSKKIQHLFAKNANETLGPLHMYMWSGLPDLVKQHRKEKRGILFIINHTSMVDPLAPHYALNSLGLSPYYMAASFLWNVPVLNVIFMSGNFIKVHRNGPRAKEAYQKALQLLKAGKIVVMYPEGHIPDRPDSGDYDPVQLKSGAARLWNESGCTVISIGQAGARKVASGSPAKWWSGLVTADFRGATRCVYVGTPMGNPTGGPSINLLELYNTDKKRYDEIVGTDTERLWVDLTKSATIAKQQWQLMTGKKK